MYFKELLVSVHAPILKDQFHADAVYIVYAIKLALEGTYFLLADDDGMFTWVPMHMVSKYKKPIPQSKVD